jgi:RimJ/RimL family protein N-acetyltransferase
MPELIEFTTARLNLRRWRESDRAPFAAMNADPEVMRYFPALWPPAMSNKVVDNWLSQFDAQGWSNWAVEITGTSEFIGFIGLSVPRRQLPFSPCVEIGWRLAPSYWHRGFATEGGRGALSIGFNRLGLSEIVSFTSITNRPSRAVMERIGMQNANMDFEHPGVPEGHPLRPHCLYKISRAEWKRNDDPLPRFAGRVVLRRLAGTDLPSFQAYRHDPALGLYQGWSATSDAEASAFLTEMSGAALLQPGVWSQIGIAEPDTLALIGDVGLLLAADGRSAEIGFTLRRQSHGRGIATIAVREAIQLVFEQTHAERVLGITDSRNLPSIRLLERAGMRRIESRTVMFRGEGCIEHLYAVWRQPGR